MAHPAPVLERTRQPVRAPLPRQSAKRIALRVGVDVMAVSAALLLASIIRFEIMGESPAKSVDYTVITALATPVWITLFWIYGLYEPRQVLSPVAEFKQLFNGVLAGTVAIFVYDAALDLEISRGWVLVALVCGVVIVGAERLAVRKALHFLRRRGGDPTPTIVLGANHEAATVVKTLERETWLGYRVLGFLDDSAPIGHQVVNGHEVIGRTADMKDLVRDTGARLVLVAASAFDASKLNRMFWELQDTDVDLQITAGTIDLLASRIAVQSVAGVPLFYVRRTGIDIVHRAMKRALDVVGSLVGVIVLAPALAAIALWIRRDSPGGAFFKQTRIGRDGKPFTCWKFRTMVADAERKRIELETLSEGPGLLFKLKEDPRVTRAGRVLRRYSFDELPQLWNVLKGEMSLVGPRPALPVEVEQYDDWVRNRLAVKPGMTGLWQVSGRTETSFADYVRYDLFYIQNWSLSLDLWILWRTLRAVVTAEGAH